VADKNFTKIFFPYIREPP